MLTLEATSRADPFRFFGACQNHSPGQRADAERMLRKNTIPERISSHAFFQLKVCRWLPVCHQPANQRIMTLQYGGVLLVQAICRVPVANTVHFARAPRIGNALGFEHERPKLGGLGYSSALRSLYSQAEVLALSGR